MTWISTSFMPQQVIACTLLVISAYDILEMSSSYVGMYSERLNLIFIIYLYRNVTFLKYYHPQNSKSLQSLMFTYLNNKIRNILQTDPDTNVLCLPSNEELCHCYCAGNTAWCVHISTRVLRTKLLQYICVLFAVCVTMIPFMMC